MRVTIERANRKENRIGYRWRVKVFEAPSPDVIESWEEYACFRTLPEAKAHAKTKRRYAHFVNQQAKVWCAETIEDGLEDGCGGTGILHCYCGGDMCVCGNNGETECLGCGDCDDSDYASDDEGEEYAGQDVDEGVADSIPEGWEA